MPNGWQTPRGIRGLAPLLDLFAATLLDLLWVMRSREHPLNGRLPTCIEFSGEGFAMAGADRLIADIR
jgi:hypothetical protein